MITENKNKSKPDVEIDMNYMNDIRDHFNDVFTNKLYSASMYEVIQILTETFQVSQVRLFGHHSLPMFSGFLFCQRHCYK